MRLLDLFCGAGGCAVGYRRAGFCDVVGVDIHRQPRYPFAFAQADAVATLRHLLNGGRIRAMPLDDAAPTYTLEDFYAVHASPPCQRFSTMTKRHGTQDNHPDLVGVTRDLLKQTGLPYVIENVPGAPMPDAVTLCGSMFGLKVRRHRLFECSFPVPTPPACDHAGQGKVVGVYGHSGGKSNRDGTTFGVGRVWREAMGVDWKMTNKEIGQSIPPAYTQWIGSHLKTYMETQS